MITITITIEGKDAPGLGQTEVRVETNMEHPLKTEASVWAGIGETLNDYMRSGGAVGFDCMAAITNQQATAH